VFRCIFCRPIDLVRIAAIVVVLYLAAPFFLESFRSGETSSNAGGLTLWAAKLLLL
jgi:TRAP-type mannitol/chloroaromatic compound transport system permease small subunit